MKTFWNQIYDWLQNRPILKNWFQKNKHFFLDLLLGIPYIVFWLNVYNKELLALRNNFRGTKKLLIAKFDCTSNIQNKHMYLPVFLTLRSSIGHQSKRSHGLFSSSKLCATVILDGFCQKLECHKGTFLGIILNPFIFIISIFQHFSILLNWLSINCTY